MTTRKEPKGYFFLLPPRGLLGKEISETDFYQHPDHNFVTARIYARGEEKNHPRSDGTYHDPRVFQYWGPVDNFIEHYSKNLSSPDWEYEGSSVYEIVPDTAIRRLFFDVDYKITSSREEYPDDIFSQVLYRSLLYLKEALLRIDSQCDIDFNRWGIYDSSTSSKISFHILPDYIVHSAQENKTITLLANQIAKEDHWEYYPSNKHWFDISVYGTKQNYRMIYSSKAGSSNVKNPIKEWKYKDLKYSWNKKRSRPNEIVRDSMVMVNSSHPRYLFFQM